MSTVEARLSEDSCVIGRIKDVMARKRMSIPMLSERSGLPYRTLQSWLLGQHRIPAAAIPRLADALGSSAEWLLRGEGAVFDKEIVIAYLDIIEQVRGLSKNQVSITECAELFIRLYNQEYTNNRTASPYDMRRLEAALAHMRRREEAATALNHE